MHGTRYVWPRARCYPTLPTTTHPSTHRSQVFSLFSINNIAQEIELPFGDDANDLPLHELQTHLNELLNTLMMKQTQQPPRFKLNANEAGHKIKSFELSNSTKLYDLVDDEANDHHAEKELMVEHHSEFQCPTIQ